MADILFEQRGAAGIITLQRPKVLNALNHAMIAAMREALAVWAADDSVSAVVLAGEGARAFCAGGDLRMFYDSAGSDGRKVREFWSDEYSLMCEIRHFPKPYLSLLHGIVMGGGMGVSVNGAYRIAASDTVCAMPETGIGFFPDVGASWFLPHAPGETGIYLGLTGARTKLEDALYVGFVTHILPRSRWNDLIAALAAGEPAGDLLRTARTKAEFPSLPQNREAIDAAFSADTVEDILLRLEAMGTAWARDTAKTLRSRSPSSLKVALKAMRAGRTLGFDDAMRMEFRVSCRLAHEPDFREGVRAAIIDKDRHPVWRPAALAGVNADRVDALFSPLGKEELPLSADRG
jgi:enoyl-CoA hydratase